MPEDRYIHEMPLVVTPPQAKVLDQRFEAARMIYNAALQEGLKRHDLCKQSKDWQKARGLLKASKTTEAKALFRATHDRHGLREYDIRDTAKCRNNAERNICWLIV